jgi:hypothetical protein
MRRGVHEDPIVLVVEPHRGQAGPPVRTDDAERLGDRPVDELPIDRIEVVEARRPLPLADRELAFLQSVGDVPKIGNDEAVTHAMPPLAPGVSAAPLRTLCKPADAPVNARPAEWLPAA